MASITHPIKSTHIPKRRSHNLFQYKMPQWFRNTELNRIKINRDSNHQQGK